MSTPGQVGQVGQGQAPGQPEGAQSFADQAINVSTCLLHAQKNMPGRQFGLLSKAKQNA